MGWWCWPQEKEVTFVLCVSSEIADLWTWCSLVGYIIISFLASILTCPRTLGVLTASFSESSAWNNRYLSGKRLYTLTIFAVARPLYPLSPGEYDRVLNHCLYGCAVNLLFLDIPTSTWVTMDPLKYQFLEANTDTMRMRMRSLSRHIDAKQLYARIQRPQTNFFGSNYSFKGVNGRHTWWEPIPKRTFFRFYALCTFETMI